VRNTYVTLKIGLGLSGREGSSLGVAGSDRNSFGTVDEVVLVLSKETHLSHSAREHGIDKSLVV